jgi:hypothetical protein
LPAVVVSTAPAYAETTSWFPTAAIASLASALGRGGLRACEACMAPRLYVRDGRMEHNFVAPTLAEIAQLDEQARGADPAARTAIWLDETASGVTLRIIEIATSKIVYAENFDARLKQRARSAQNATATAELERRMRGDGLVHTFIDVGVAPGQHLSGDWVEQWGPQNENLTGVSVSLFDPILGIGAAYYRVIPQAFGISVGAKAMVSVPRAVITAIDPDAEVDGTGIDPLLTGVGVVRVPLFDTNYGLLLTASTNGRFTIGLSLLNISLLPVLP